MQEGRETKADMNLRTPNLLFENLIQVAAGFRQAQSANDGMVTEFGVGVPQEK